MTSSAKIEELLQEFRRLLASEYHRGEQDAIARIMKAAQDMPNATNGSVAAGHIAKNHGRKVRAKPGAPTALIERVLRERGQRGASAAEIHEAATTDAESQVSLSGIRFVLTKGRDEKLYYNKSGKWFLRREKETAGHDADHKPAAVLPMSNSR